MIPKLYPETNGGRIAANETDGLGDTSTLADPGVVSELIENRVG
jgi:acetyl-CoA synthetase